MKSEKNKKRKIEILKKQKIFDIILNKYIFFKKQNFDISIFLLVKIKKQFVYCLLKNSFL